MSASHNVQCLLFKLVSRCRLLFQTGLPPSKTQQDTSQTVQPGLTNKLLGSFIYSTRSRAHELHFARKTSLLEKEQLKKISIDVER